MINIRQSLADIHAYNINVGNREIYLHSYYSELKDGEPGVEFRQATTFIKNLHLLDQEPFDPILIHLHCIGGCWYNGMAIFNVIQGSKSAITMLAYSQASSMSGILLQAPSVRLMMPDCHFMMHQGADGVYTHPFAVKSNADFVMKGCNRMLQVYAERAIVGEFFKKKKSCTVQYVYKFFDNKIKEKVDWYLTADEAMYYGLCDGILGSKQYPDVHSLRSKSIDTNADISQNEETSDS